MTYQIQRLATGAITAYALLNTDSYLLFNWTIQTDQSTIEWTATMPEYGLRSQWAGGIELGSGRRVSPYSGIVEFFLLTELMQQYIRTNILNSKPVELVTLSAYDDETREVSVYTGELVAPFFSNAEATYTPSGHRIFANVQYGFRGGTKIEVTHLLTEASAILTTESGLRIALEQTT